ncbi:ABC transporter permease [Candidatus Thioglobus sp.]|nr:ABC transporter permease [Candidatus Thioglobus sp.]MDA8981022.1 ABC transporter permease [Candidatus Thioglobus sp.]
MIKLIPRVENSTAMVLLSPLLALTLTALSAYLIFVFILEDIPVSSVFFTLFVEPLIDSYYFSELLVKAAPLMIIGLGLSIGFRAGIWNIGAEGQYVMGGIAGSAVAVYFFDVEAVWLLPLMAIVGILGGMFYAGIAAFLRIRYQVNEILVTLMLSYVAVFFLSSMLQGPLQDPSGFNFPESRMFHDSALMPIIWQGTRVHIGLIVAIILSLVAWFGIKKHMFGMQIKISGSAPRAAKFAGFDDNKTVWYSLLISGGLAGLAGLFEAAGPVGQLNPGLPQFYGFTAIIVAFLARLHPVGVLFSSLLIALSYVGGENVQIDYDLPKSITQIFQGMLLFYFLACDILIKYKVVLFKTKN